MLASCMFPLMLSSGCALIRQIDRIMPPSVDLSISQITPQRDGQYLVSGSTTLPDQTRLTVSAVRSLQPKNQQTVSNQTYAILDRQIIAVKQQSWAANLAISRSFDQGEVKESWQRRWVGLEPVADSNVTFFVTLEPPDQPVEIQQQLDAPKTALKGGVIRFTTDGERYFQASKTLTVSPPAVQSVTMPPSAKVDRSVVPLKAKTDSVESQGFSQPAIDMPMAPDAFLN